MFILLIYFSEQKFQEQDEQPRYKNNFENYFWRL